MLTLRIKFYLIAFIAITLVSSLFAQRFNVVTIFWNGEHVECVEDQIVVALASGVSPEEVSGLF